MDFEGLKGEQVEIKTKEEDYYGELVRVLDEFIELKESDYEEKVFIRSSDVSSIKIIKDEEEIPEREGASSKEIKETLDRINEVRSGNNNTSFIVLLMMSLIIALYIVNSMGLLVGV